MPLIEGTDYELVNDGPEHVPAIVFINKHYNQGDSVTIRYYNDHKNHDLSVPFWIEHALRLRAMAFTEQDQYSQSLLDRTSSGDFASEIQTTGTIDEIQLGDIRIKKGASTSDINRSGTDRITIANRDNSMIPTPVPALETYQSFLAQHAESSGGFY